MSPRSIRARIKFYVSALGGQNEKRNVMSTERNGARGMVKGDAQPKTQWHVLASETRGSTARENKFTNVFPDASCILVRQAKEVEKINTNTVLWFIKIHFEYLKCLNSAVRLYSSG